MIDTLSADPLDDSPLVQQFDDDEAPAWRETRAENAGAAADTGPEATAADASPEATTTAAKLSVTETAPEESVVWRRFKFILKVCRVYIQIFILFTGLCSIYWGTFFHRDDRFVNAKMLVVSEDTSFSSDNGTTIQPLLGDAFTNMLFQNKTVSTLGGWTMANMTDFTESATRRNNTPLEEISRLIHHQKYWVGIYIAPNATQMIYDSLATANTSLIDSGQISQLISFVYETGRHYSGLNQYITKNLNTISLIWMDYYVSLKVYDIIIQQLLSDSQRQALAANISLVSTRPTINMIDNRPAHSAAVLGPSELGLLYAQIFSFHQFNFSREFHELIKDKLRFKHYLVFRVLSSQVNYLVLSLVYALITIAFQVPVNVAFGRSGFLVLWMFMFLYIGACGGLNEVVGTVLLQSGKNFLIPPWIVFNMVSNMATTFSPIILAPNFYRYGYAMPMYNGYEALKVVFFNTWKGHLGRNIGVLLAWIALMNIVGVTMVIITNRKAKALEAKEKAEKAEAAPSLQKA